MEDFSDWVFAGKGWFLKITFTEKRKESQKKFKENNKKESLSYNFPLADMLTWNMMKSKFPLGQVANEFVLGFFFKFHFV